MRKALTTTRVLSAAMLALSGNAHADCTTHVAGLIGYANQSAPARLQVSLTGKLIFSDRFSTGSITGNPYAIRSPEYFSIYVNPTGRVWIYKQTWGYWTDFQGECLKNVLYGWGAPIGLNNGSDKAMYVISFAKISHGYL
jgi:hypothetical protein